MNKICIHHTDAERQQAQWTCPVCAFRILTALRARLAEVAAELRVEKQFAKEQQDAAVNCAQDSATSRRMLTALRAEIIAEREENQFLQLALDAFEWQRINSLSVDEVKKELLASGYTQERLDAGFAKIIATVEKARATLAKETKL